MNAVELITELNARGVMLQAMGDRLKVDAPMGAVTLELRQALVWHKAEVLSLLQPMEDEIGWRVEVMLPQIPDAGAIPFLVARQSAMLPMKECHSCGEPLSVATDYVCGLCSRAKHRALEIAMHRREKHVEDGLSIA